MCCQDDKKLIITIDGPAASGKSTTARLVAQKLGWIYLDTGAMYRAVSVKVVQKGIALDDTQSISELADKIQVTLEPSEKGMRVFVDQDEVTDQIRTPEIDKAVGPVCEVPRVREVMVSLQREVGEKGNVVAEGRDMGTVVFPKADLKIFMKASPEGRALRRQKDMAKQGVTMSLEDIKNEIERRDKRDIGRDHSPLIQAEDAIILDTTHMTIEKQVAFVIDHIQEIASHDCYC